MSRMVRVGIDYGTSMSKLVFRDPAAAGGEKAYVVVHNGSFRVPSSVAFIDDEFVFGFDRSTTETCAAWFESVKMRVAEEAKGDNRKYCYAPHAPLPAGVSSAGLAALTVWFLLGIAHQAAASHLGCKREDVAVSTTLGIPMSFYDDPALRNVFLFIARTARRIYDECGPMVGDRVSMACGRDLLTYYAVDGGSRLEDGSDLRDYIRSEAESALWFTLNSPSVAPGPYAEVDIGAGTTHSSIFWVREAFRAGQWQRDHLAFYSARSFPYGMDAVDERLALFAGIPADQRLGIRGQEWKLIQKFQVPEIKNSFLDLRWAYESAWRQACPRLSLPEKQRFRTHDVFVIGGGSLIPELTAQYREHPDHYPQLLRTRSAERPDDLVRTDGKDLLVGDLPFVSVAYGLSFDAGMVPKPDQEHECVEHPERAFVHYEDR